MYTPAAAKRDPVYVLEQRPKHASSVSCFQKKRKEKKGCKGDEGAGRPAMLLGVTEVPPDVSREADHQHLDPANKITLLATTSQ
jgi:hypothetical protein